MMAAGGLRSSFIAPLSTSTVTRRPGSFVSLASPKRNGVSTIRAVSTQGAPSNTQASSDLPFKEIPGTYGVPFFGAIKDRLDFMWFNPPPKFYQNKQDEYQSTVFRTNVPPGPPFFPDPRVVCIVDEKSYPILFDVSQVEKKDVFVGTYTPSWKLTAGFRVLSYLDPSEERHTKLKNFTFEMLKKAGPSVIPNLSQSFTDCFQKWEATLAKDGKVSYADGIATACFQYVLKSFTSRDPYLAGTNSIGENGYKDASLWLIAQIGPISTVPVPKILAPVVELFLHTLRIPPILVKLPYEKIVNFYKTYASEMLAMGTSKFGLDYDDVLHNMIFLNVFNTYGGVNILFPSIVKRLGSTSDEYQKELADEVAKALKDNGGQITPKSLGAMPLVESALYEVLRIDPPVPFQYAHAKKDLVIESHDAKFKVKKGEMIHGFMPVATHDPKVFTDPDTFLPKRFVSADGKKLLKYVIWSNGPLTEDPTIDNKQCAGKDFVHLVGKAFLAVLYSKYQKLEADTSGNITALKPVQK